VVLEALAPQVIAQHYAVAPTSQRVYLYYPAYLIYLCKLYGPMLGRVICGNRQLTARLAREYQASHVTAWLASGWTDAATP